MSSAAESAAVAGSSARIIVVPLALAQFVASFAATNMNVAISNIAHDLSTTVFGVQTAITLFTLVMAALMIPGSKLTDVWGRKRCLVLGLIIYGAGALLGALAPRLGLLIVGYSILEGIGSALLIPPIYILITVAFTDLKVRTRYFGIISAAAGVGAATGPLIGGIITTAISWRASFILQVLIVLTVIWLSRRIPIRDKVAADRQFDIGGSVLSAAGLVLVVTGILLSRSYGWGQAREAFVIAGRTLIQPGGLSPVWIFLAIGAAFLLWFFVHIRRREQHGLEPLLSTRLFGNSVSNFGLVTQGIQWLTLQGLSFVIAVFVQTIRGYSAIATGLILLPATIGLLVTSTRAPRMAERFTQSRIIRWGFVFTIVGIGLLILFVRVDSPVLSFVPGLLVGGAAIGAMLTASVNVVQSSFPEKDQGEISGLSRSISNLGSSLGTAIAGSVLVSSLVVGNTHFLLALTVLIIFDAIGLLAALGIPVHLAPAAEAEQPASRPTGRPALRPRPGV